MSNKLNSLFEEDLNISTIKNDTNFDIEAVKTYNKKSQKSDK
jgi:hypothetical protein